MNVVVLIDGREAIPVRAIPFVTGWWLSPDLLARSFAHPDSWRWMGEVTAHEWHGGTTPDLKRHYTQQRLRTAVGLLMLSPDFLRR